MAPTTLSVHPVFVIDIKTHLKGKGFVRPLFQIAAYAATQGIWILDAAPAVNDSVRFQSVLPRHAYQNHGISVPILPDARWMPTLTIVTLSH
jgi:hypothetical protein